MRPKDLRSSLLIVLVSLLMFGCPWIESVDQPTIVSTDSSFTSILRIGMEDTTHYNGLAHLAILLPEGWIIADSIPYAGCTEGVFMLDSFITDTVNTLWPAEPGYYWWGGIASDTLICEYETPIEITPHIETGPAGGAYIIDYRLGDNNMYQVGSGFLSLYSSNDIFAMPQADLYGEVFVSPEGSWGGDGTSDDPLRTVSEALFRLVVDSLTPGTIYLADGYYSHESGGELFPMELLSYTSIIGESEAGVILYAGGDDQIFKIDSSRHVSLINLSITGGRATNGGGILCNYSDLTLSNVTFNGNVAYGSGGGLFCQNSDPQLTNVTFSNNSADLGGGIYCVNSDPVITEVSILENSADFGGGIYLVNSSPVLTEVNLTDNNASQNGGGLFCSNANPTLSNLTLSSNVARRGGGAYCTNSNPIFLDVGFLNNRGREEGGGIFIDSSEINLHEMVLRGNVSGTGGGLYINNSNISLSNVSISQNASSMGGGFFCDDSSSVLFSTENRCNIYSNIIEGYGGGQEIVSYSEMDVVLDTSTVMQPTAYHASPRTNFTFDILNGLHEQVDSDMYVSVDGDDSNNGRLINTPVKTIRHAIEVILADSANPRTIYLTEGIYSAATNGEDFPLNMVEDVSIRGESIRGVILDPRVEQYSRSGAIGINEVRRSMLSNLTITGAGGANPAIKCSASSPNLSNLLLVDNFSGGIYCDRSSPMITDITIANVFGYGISLGNHSHPTLINSILWNMGTDEIEFYGEDTCSILVAHSDIHHGLEGVNSADNQVVTWAESNLDVLPGFVDYYQDDFHLQETSPCIDMGTPFFTWNGDTLVNMQADEYTYAAPDMGALESPYAIGIHDESIIPNEFALNQNFPNPFNPSTRITYALPEPVEVSIMIYDVLGREVVNLVSESQTAGNKDIVWDGTNKFGNQVSTGMYLYMIQAGPFTQTRKMLLLK
ncbi:MAG: T9SS type A sorting domain-containing protein [FCB group bacterium]|nr:T9SS type A sorting domain-containing protein [FCB group bacterium]MBL7028220.1 T9SS type A sorting domain-containing protein [Candidatus Neomarinimicrobiota bacterium]MBL7122474.1 T9SS type A sorting domain-containing protein [Candidatus Neomarinimicrobiota bacterium]